MIWMYDRPTLVEYFKFVSEKFSGKCPLFFTHFHWKHKWKTYTTFSFLRWKFWMVRCVHFDWMSFSPSSLLNLVFFPSNIHRWEAGSPWTSYSSYMQCGGHLQRWNGGSNPSSAFVAEVHKTMWRVCWSLFPSLSPRPSFKVVLAQFSV
jgi:hypothetical protein